MRAKRPRMSAACRRRPERPQMSTASRRRPERPQMSTASRRRPDRPQMSTARRRRPERPQMSTASRRRPERPQMNTARRRRPERPRRGRGDDTLTKVNKFLQPFCLSKKVLLGVSSKLRWDMIRGLGKYTHLRSPVKMLPTFVRATPDGTEKGNFLVLDLGGTKLRLVHVRMGEDPRNVQNMGSEEYVVSENIKKGSGQQLFDHIASCLSKFLDSLKLKQQTLPLGFSFSFPCEQKDIDKAILINWTKSFSCSGVEGKDVVQLLRDAIRRRGGYDIGPVAVVNDTVGTMMSYGYRCQSCEIGLIIGTGTNACYMEKMKNVKRVEGEDGQMCINTEWGAFGDDGALKDIQTEFDVALDRTTDNAGFQTFEKMIGGKYLGEIVRLVLVKLAEDGLLFDGQLSDKLLTHGSFETRLMSHIEEEESGLEKTREILVGLGLEAGPVDCQVVRLVCDTVSTRSASLCAAGLATIANQIRLNCGLDRRKTTVGVDGAVYKKHPNFRDQLQATVQGLAPECEINFLCLGDGEGKAEQSKAFESGEGAAIVMAVAQRLARQEEAEGGA
ncbi:hexokinase-2-like [Lampris incognitus]|uniref:hexokinase-2-like n=1 Tax=Lampris incognitus TaxID=2546036 RepID=UPI0024B5CE65|nr:hexokinase-2-like [Lampris incognitus]